MTALKPDRVAARSLEDHTPAEQDWYLKLAQEWVLTVSKSLASREMRRRAAYQYLIMAAISEYADGAGNVEAAKFLNRMADVLRGD